MNSSLMIICKMNSSLMIICKMQNIYLDEMSNVGGINMRVVENKPTREK